MENSGRRDKLGITNTVFSLQLEISHFYVIFIKLLLDLQMFFAYVTYEPFPDLR